MSSCVDMTNILVLLLFQPGSFGNPIMKLMEHLGNNYIVILSFYVETYNLLFQALQ